MKSSSMKIIAGLFLFFAMVTAYDFYNENSEKVKLDSKSQIIPFAEDQISELILEKETEKIYLQRGVDGWQMISPVKDWCDNQSIDETIKALTAEKYKAVATDKVNADLKAFGLDQPKAKMTFKNNQGKMFSVLVSNRQNFEGDQFLQIQDQKSVYVANSIWGQSAGKNSTSFRDRRLVRYKMASLQEMTFQNNSKTETLKSMNNQWVSLEHPDWILDQNKVREYIQLLGDTQASEFIWQGEQADESIQSKYNINRAAFHLHLKLNETDWRADFSKDKEKWTYAMVNLPHQLLKLEPGQFDKIQNFNVNAFRDLSIPFKIKSAQITELLYQNKIKKTHLKLNAGQWSAINDPLLKIDQEKVKLFFDKFQKSKSFRFVNLKNPLKESIQLLGEDKELLFELKWSDEFKIIDGPIEKEVVLAQSSRVKDLFLIEKAEMAEWGLADIYK